MELPPPPHEVLSNMLRCEFIASFVPKGIDDASILNFIEKNKKPVVVLTAHFIDFSLMDLYKIRKERKSMIDFLNAMTLTQRKSIKENNTLLDVFTTIHETNSEFFSKFLYFMYNHNKSLSRMSGCSSVKDSPYQILRRMSADFYQSFPTDKKLSDCPPEMFSFLNKEEYKFPEDSS
jgi:hypothetical protein